MVRTDRLRNAFPQDGNDQMICVNSILDSFSQSFFLNRSVSKQKSTSLCFNKYDLKGVYFMSVLWGAVGRGNINSFIFLCTTILILVLLLLFLCFLMLSAVRLLKVMLSQMPARLAKLPQKKTIDRQHMKKLIIVQREQ